MRFARIRSQIVFYYLALLVVSMIASGIMYQRINEKFTEEKVGEVSLQTLNAMNSGIESLLDSTNNYSKMIVSNNTVQEILGSDLAGNDIGILTYKLEVALSDFMLAEPSISSVYLFDNAGRKFAIDLQSAKPIRTDGIESAEWYSEAVALDGKAIWRKNAGGIFNFETKEPQQDPQYISLIRIVNDMNTSKKIGVLVVNITVQELKKSYERSINDNKPDLMIETGYETLLDFTRPELLTYTNSSMLDVPLGSSKIVKIKDHNYLISSLVSMDRGWKFTSAQPLGEWESPYRQFNLMLLMIMLFNFISIFLGSVWISRFITTPILHMLRSMKKVEIGEFSLVRYEARTDELNQLKDRYNNMIMTIEQALKREKEEQKLIRKLELDILQQQIKPHFLYNTLESAGYLTLSGNNNEAYQIISELAAFYRQSLSRGSDVVTLREEVEITKSYLSIQNIRYPEIFTSEIEVPEEAEYVRIPKLTLQPLVENALYHGIRPLGECGKIRILARIQGNRLKLIVEDDGVGMNEDKRREMQAEPYGQNESSFGLRGTLMRLKLYYGADMNCSLVSAPGEGTRIELELPLEEGNSLGA
ncbi:MULTISPECIES: sensor histidine kinase [Paenibacillus]|uniref:cache domain-containing sensor histidine kinase n=1 Tax=Paenibacillus TaxID=44249 RepID=UPI00096FF009|nr:sensor histidine kinase [Paenibacillus odorifer]OMC96670.1 hypothetical protein BJP46_05150 [Paenibacillus odorifer]OME59040.1 hypothetical protein BSK59_07790 [Paenibacillus odorifer]